MPDDLNAAADASPLRTLDADAEQRMIAHIDEIKRAGNTLGGICEVVVDGLPVGLGSHVSWDRKLDGRIGAAIMSIPAVKGVEIGMGFQAARVTGAEVHDEIELAPGRTLRGQRSPQDESRRRARGRDDDGRAARRARRDEADQHLDAAARRRWTSRPARRRRRSPSEAT